jgi:hypothetical protein
LGQSRNEADEEEAGPDVIQSHVRMFGEAGRTVRPDFDRRRRTVWRLWLFGLCSIVQRRV